VAKRKNIELERALKRVVKRLPKTDGKSRQVEQIVSPQTRSRQYISPLLMSLILDEYGRKGDREGVRVCVEIMKEMKW